MNLRDRIFATSDPVAGSRILTARLEGRGGAGVPQTNPVWRPGFERSAAPSLRARLERLLAA